MSAAPPIHRILPIGDVMKKTSLSRSVIYKEMSAGRFPCNVQLTPKRCGWVESQVDAWIEAAIQKAQG